MAGTPFLKMHGLGNDFVVLDARGRALDLTPPRRRAIADRRLGVGCDQLIVLEAPTESEADVFMRIYNPEVRRPRPAATPRAASPRWSWTSTSRTT